MRRPGLALALLLAAPALAGCGRAGDEAAVRDVGQAFLGALARGDGRAACAQLSSDTAKSLAEQEGAPCATAITSAGIKPAALGAVRVYVTNAQVDEADGEALFLSHEQDGWKLSAAGCRPQAGKPADVPFDCRVQD